MKTKLTLTIEQKIIERAKEYAKGKNRSLSDIIENYLKILTEQETGRGKPFKPDRRILERIVQTAQKFRL